MLKLHEVLALPAVLSGDLWIRPVGTTDHGYCVMYTGYLAPAPTYSDSIPFMTAYVAFLVGDWEAVTPSKVLGGEL